MLNLARAAISELIRLAVPVVVALAVLIPMLLALSNWWAGQNDAHRLGLVPEVLRVSRTIDYVYGGDQTPLPSANSNGLVIYELPASIAQRIASGGIAELQGLLGGQRQQQQPFDVWYETPLDSRSLRHLSQTGPGERAFGDFMRRSWQRTESPALERDAAHLLLQPGSFYSFDREDRRLLIVAPSAGRVVFAFSE